MRIRIVSLSQLLFRLSLLSLSLVLSGCDLVGDLLVCRAGNTDCPGNLYCHFESGCGEEGDVGFCRARPEACTLEYAPVCGCDGETYGNACGAASAQVNVASEGECEAEVCGGLQGLPCDEGEFCHFEEGTCGAADQTGVCEQVPEACPEIFAPVCGCDDRTYGNECEAFAAGVSVASDGPCQANGLGPECGGTHCEPTAFCLTPVGECDNLEAGVCTELPEACDAVIEPVCGCDGQTYTSECEANRVGVSVLAAGECTGEEAPLCGSTVCEADEFCKTPDGSCDDLENGVCTRMPEGCGTAANPVCGCDGETYPNECEAGRAGVSVQAAGACGGPG